MEIPFAPIRVEDRDWIEPLLRRGNEKNCEYSFVSNYAWSRIYSFKVAKLDDFYLLVSTRRFRGYLCPIGGEDLRKPMEAILEDAKSHNAPFYMYSISESQRQALEAAFPERFTFAERRDAADYIYDRESLATLAGKKLHAKRNHINAFEAAGGTYLPLTPDRVEDCIAMHREWLSEQSDADAPEKSEEADVSLFMLRNFEQLHLKGGMALLNDKVVAYTLGEPLSNDTFVVHVEKAFADVRGAYSFINREFVRNAMEGFSYVNREDDAGDEGLRKAKLSYHPSMLYQKYDAVLRGQEHLL